MRLLKDSDVIKAIDEHTFDTENGLCLDDDITCILEKVQVAYDEQSVQDKQKEPCGVCQGLGIGDTLYSFSYCDGGIGFDYIRDIKYCPVCGRRLREWVF